MKLSVIIPVYNEEQAIASTISKVKKYIVPHAQEVIIVNDGSTDKSGKILRKINGITLLQHKVNKGYGASLKTGIKHANGDIILITDADGTYPIENFLRLYEYMAGYDMVIGARNKKQIPFIRRPAKKAISILADFLTNQKIPDLNSGLRIFRKDLAMRFWNLYPQGFSFTTTLTMAALTHGYDVKFVPISYRKRKGTSSIHPIKDTIGFIQLIFRLSLYFNPLKVFLQLSVMFFVLAILRSIRDLLVTENQAIGSLGIILFVMSFQLFFFGLIADIINKK